MGWAGMTNGELLQQASDEFEAFVTMDGNLSFQQNLERCPFGIVTVLYNIHAV